MPSSKITIHYQDEHILIVDKPANLLTVPGRGPDNQDCLIHRLLVDWPNARIIHRLDMATSGLVIIALSHTAQASMGRLFEQRSIQKTYIAVVSGKTDTQGEIDLPLICDWDNRPKQMVDINNGKSAQTQFSRIHYDPQKNTSTVALHPITGRSHQLRVHMLAIGHPIIGDYFYAPEDIKNQSTRLLLHAHQLEFTHPLTQHTLTITSPVPF